MNRSEYGQVFVLRHGRTALNVADRLRGHLDPPLDEVGRAEVADLAADIVTHFAGRHPARILSSPLTRALDTAGALSRRTGVPVEPEPRLVDRAYGEWTGHRRSEVAQRWGRVDDAPGVEPAGEVLRRAREVLDEQIDAPGTVVLVSHDAVNRELLHALAPRLGDRDAIGQRTACWNLLVRADGGWVVEQVDRRPGG